MKDWFFWKKRPAHDPCHGKPVHQSTLRVAAATIAVTMPLALIFETPPPCIIDRSAWKKFNAASESQGNPPEAEKILHRDQKIDPDYRP